MRKIQANINTLFSCFSPTTITSEQKKQSLKGIMLCMSSYKCSVVHELREDIINRKEKIRFD